MTKVLSVTTAETLPKSIQFTESGKPKDLTGYTITCRIGTNPVTVKTAAVIDPLSGVGAISFNGLPAGTFNAEIIMTNTDGILPSELFTITVRNGI